MHAPTPTTDRSNGQCIALVEPNPRPALLTALRNAGYQVSSYTHPLQAMEAIVDKPVKVALIAQELPWMSGSALARTLRDSYRVPEVVLLDMDMSEDTIVARVRSAAPPPEVKPEPRPRKPVEAPARDAAARGNTTGRRILIRTARPR